ncbi:MAG: helix-turn-helix transcriptional regulator [Acidimicrobiales bacterium]
MAAPWTALIGHDDRLLVEVLAAACARRGVVVVGDTSPDEVAGLYARLRPDVVVCADRFGPTAVEDAVLSELLDLGARVIVLTDDESAERMVSLLGREIMGCCRYEATPAEMAEAIVAVAEGAAALTPTVARSLLDEWRRSQRATPRHPPLTPRERDIVVAMADGLSGKAIAARLGVALKTVENHKLRVFGKLGVRTQAHAVTVALARGLTSPAPGAP